MKTNLKQLQANPPGQIVQPDGVSYKQADGHWQTFADLDSIAKRWEFSTAPTDSLVLVESVEGRGFQQSSTAGLNIQPNRQRNQDGTFPELYLFKVVTP